MGYSINDIISILDVQRDHKYKEGDLVGRVAYCGLDIQTILEKANKSEITSVIDEVSPEFFLMSNGFICDYVILKK